MVKSFTTVGESGEITFDAAILQSAMLAEGDRVNLEIHNDGTITLLPLDSRPALRDVDGLVGEVIGDYSGTLSELAK